MRIGSEEVSLARQEEAKQFVIKMKKNREERDRARIEMMKHIDLKSQIEH